MFIGQKTGEKVTIRNWLKNELFLIYDRKVASEIYYTISNGDKNNYIHLVLQKFVRALEKNN